MWILWGYSEAFGAGRGRRPPGQPLHPLRTEGTLDQIYGYVPADAATGTAAAGGIPAPAFVAFQVVFAIIAVALVSGAIADRAKFSAWTVFTVVWATLVYFPAAHWVFAFSGYAAETGGWIANKADGLLFGGAAPTTSRVEPRSTSTPARPASPWRSCSASASGSPRSRCVRTT